MAEHTLSCIDLGFERGRGAILEEINLSANNSEILVIQGKNGSGKSTLLKLMAGILKPKAGRIEYDGQNIQDIRHFGANIAYIGHELAIKPQLTVYENIEFWGRMYKRPELIDTALRYFDLDTHYDMPCGLLSAGWKQRVALARLIVSPAKIWLLDEPMTHMDNEGIALIESLIATRKEQSGCIIMSLHGSIKSDNIKTFNIN